MSKNISRVRASGLVLAHGLWRHGLSLKTMGLLYMLLDLAELPDWEFSLQGLVALAQQHDMGDGRDAIRTAIAELEDKAFLVRQRDRSDVGRLGGSQWLVSDAPMTENSQDQEPAAVLPTSENPTLVNRLQEGSSSIEEEKKEQDPLNPPVAVEQPASFARAAMELWNTQAPGHWVRIRDLGQQRQRRLNGLIREFGSAGRALIALERSLQQAHQEDWCIKASARLSLENWLSNGKVRQYSEKLQAASEPATAGLSSEQREIAELAAQHPDLFTGTVVADGVLQLRYSAMVRLLANYPEQGMVNTVGALDAEIKYLQSALAKQKKQAATSPF